MNKTITNLGYGISTEYRKHANQPFIHLMHRENGAAYVFIKDKNNTSSTWVDTANSYRICDFSIKVIKVQNGRRLLED